MTDKKTVKVDYVARVEGEAAIVVNIDGQTDLKLKIFEPPRFFEGFLAGRKYDEAGDLVSRICGICPVSHMTTAIQAVEKAMGIKVSRQTDVLRKLMCTSQVVASHLIHLYMLAMPDYYGFPGIVQMRGKFNKQIERLMKMKEVMNGITGLIGGRALHCVTALPGGFTAVPSNGAFAPLLKQLKEIQPLARDVVLEIASLEIPDFHTSTEYVALDNENDYAINDGSIVSTEGLDIPVEDYPQVFKETQTDYAFTKKSAIANRGAMMCGALARMNNKFVKLSDNTKKLAKEAGFSVPCDNPFKNNLAQALEAADGIERCIKLIESNTFKDEDIHVSIRAGEGASITEAPRGLLYHWFKINSKGVIEQANLVTPTSHNFQNIENDLKKLVEVNKDQESGEIKMLCEKLVRAYDPCFSCSVH